MEKIKRTIKSTFFAGLVVVVPIVITALALYWLFGFLDGFLSPLIHGVIGREIPGLGLVTEVVLIFLVGAVATNVLGSRLLKFLQDFLMRIPLVKTIYPTIKQVVEAFHPSSSSSFKKVVLVEYPKSGILTLGFLTREVSMKEDSSNQRYYAVYLPTNNLYLGQVALFKAEEVMVPGLTIEEGLKIILSGGTAFPPTIQRQDFKSTP